MRSLAIAVAAIAVGTGVTSVAELLNDDVPDGFESADEADADLTFEEYAPLAPEATAHVEATSAEARAMRAAVDVWTAGDGDILLREITRWTTDDAARAFVEQAVVVGIESGLEEADAPFEGGVAFLGADEGLWTRTLSWRQGPYGVTVSHFALEEGTDRTIGEAAASLASNIRAATDHTIAPAGARSASITEGTTSGGGVPIGTVVIWVIAIAGVIWLVKFRRNVAARADEPGGRENDAIVDPSEDRTPSGGI